LVENRAIAKHETTAVAMAGAVARRDARRLHQVAEAPGEGDLLGVGQVLLGKDQEGVAETCPIGLRELGLVELAKADVGQHGAEGPGQWM
jgi:hypothetical protein